MSNQDFNDVQPDVDSNVIVSVVIPTYNRAQLLSRAIVSVLDQTLSNLELIVVDDGSTDNTADVVRSFCDSRIRYTPLGKNCGGAYARNQGIQLAIGEFIAFLDSDDIWLPEKLEKQIAALRNSNNSQVTVAYCSYHEEHELTQRTISVEADRAGDVFDDLLQGWCPPSSASIVKRSELNKVGGFDESLPSFQDYDLWLRLAEASNQFVAISEPLLIKHVHNNHQVSVDPTAKLRGFEIFQQRWSATMKHRLGVQSYHRWVADHLSHVQLSQLKLALARGKRLLAWQHFLGMTKFLPYSRKLMLKGLFFAVVGEKTYAFVAEANHNLSKKTVEKLSRG